MMGVPRDPVHYQQQGGTPVLEDQRAHHPEYARLGLLSFYHDRLLKNYEATAINTRCILLLLVGRSDLDYSSSCC
jgi:hypothetical protein